MFKDVIQDDSDDSDKPRRLRPNYKMESIQYEGGKS